MRYQYYILVAKNNPSVTGGIEWVDSEKFHSVGPNLPAILNHLGALGWEVVAVGNLGFDGHNDILFKRPVQQ